MLRSFQNCSVPILLILTSIVSCKTSSGVNAVQETVETAEASPADGSQIAHCAKVAGRYQSVELQPGSTYLSFMQKQVKPLIDKVSSVKAGGGYNLADADGVQSAYECGVDKIKDMVNKIGLETMKKIATEVQPRQVDMRTASARIREYTRSKNLKVNEFDVGNFLGYASGGGVKVSYDELNYSLNVHYGSGREDRDEQTGRSYGVGPKKGANDASDADYLKELQSYTRRGPDELAKFYQVIFDILLNSDGSNYSQVNAEGQGVLSDFFAIYTAEQDRNLMRLGKTIDHIVPYWDAALLEVTLLAAFHAAQPKFQLFYNRIKDNSFIYTSQTLKQTPCDYPTKGQDASMVDYWQFSRSWVEGWEKTQTFLRDHPDLNKEDRAKKLAQAEAARQQNCRRSGINLTKPSFRMMGTKITQWIRTHEAEVFDRLVSVMKFDPANVTNVYADLSFKLISDQGLVPLANATEARDAWVDFIKATMAHAKDIDESLKASEAPPPREVHDADDGHDPQTQRADG